MPRTPEFTAVAEAATDDRSRREHHLVLAQVIEFDDAKRMCSVQPLQGVRRATGEWVLLPAIHSVPLQVLRLGGFVIAAPAAPGDVVILQFADASLERFLTDGNGDPVDPQDYRRRHLSDAIAMPGIDPNRADQAFATGGDLVIGRSSTGVQIRVKANGKLSIANTTADLLGIIDNLAAALQSATTLTALGAQPLDAATQTALATFRSQLGTLKV